MQTSSDYYDIVISNSGEGMEKHKKYQTDNIGIIYKNLVNSKIILIKKKNSY